MKQLVLFLLLSFTANIIFSQDTIRSLIFSEARIDLHNMYYIELTNMGSDAIRLNQFEIGRLSGDDFAFIAKDSFYTRLPDKILDAGESYLICTAIDYGLEQFKLGFTEDFKDKYNNSDLLEKADLIVHMDETTYPYAATDSITPIFNNIFKNLGISCLYIEQHLPNGDSVVIDQFNGVFDNQGKFVQTNRLDIAGFPNPKSNSVLIRKFIFKTGNLDFYNARGIGEDDSEWIVIPNNDYILHFDNPWNKAYWTIGNHTDIHLDEKTLESDIAKVDFENKTITVPWGTRRTDGIMNYFKEKPGIAWNYILNPYPEDSLALTAKTGDKLVIFACGNKVEKDTFGIIVSDPLPGDNEVIPVIDRYPTGWWRNLVKNTVLNWPRITKNTNTMDTIWGYAGGIPFAVRTDSLLDVLEKPSNASWEFELDDMKRTEIKTGDILKVSAQNGNEKKYYIVVNDYLPNHDATLSAITWPDIPEKHKGFLGWETDTLPNFSSSTFKYKLKIPFDFEGIPSFVAKTNHLNATVETKRATNIFGKINERTIRFIVTAEDGINTQTYSIELEKEKSPENIQPFETHPFLSEFVFWDQWSNSFAEICNPGTVPLDLSNYMFAMAWNSNPAEVIESRMEENHWLDRFDKYVPGYKWVSEEEWKTNPGILVSDLAVNPIIQPGDVFCFGGIGQDGFTEPNWIPDYIWPVPSELDVQFNNHQGLNTYKNPWNEPISTNGSPVRKWFNSNWYMFKILNDSIKLGLKPANDPHDFELIESFGMATGDNWRIGGEPAQMISSYVRKPEIYQGNPEIQSSFGTNPEDCEWTWTNWNYWKNKNVGWPLEILYVGHDIGHHYFNPPTHYMSTIKSEVYKVSEGYTWHESIRGIITGTTVAQFLEHIIKSNDKQVLKVVNKKEGKELPQDALLELNDTLIVISADSANTTKYILEVNETGLSSNAILTSDQYNISIVNEPKTEMISGQTNTGTAIIKGFEYGTTLRTVLANITVPDGALLTTINGREEYVPTKMLNFNKTYANVTVNNNIYFDVLAENGITRIVYQLVPEVSENDAFITSDVYAVSQKDILIEYVPRRTNVSTLLDNLYPSAGASLKLVNKFGKERLFGPVFDDDKVIVTSANGLFTRVYYISMLAERYIPETTYLAYLLSDFYEIDQLNNTIYGVSSDLNVLDLFTRIEAAKRATFVLTDMNGYQKTSGTVAETDLIKVTSLDGKHVVYYHFDPATSNTKNIDNHIMIFPNPNNGKLYVQGAESGSQLDIFNLTGALLQSITTTSNLEIVFLKNNPPGIYHLVLRKNNLVRVFKIIKY